MQQYHTQTALADTSTYRQRQLSTQQLLVEVQLFTVFLML